MGKLRRSVKPVSANGPPSDTGQGSSADYARAEKQARVASHRLGHQPQQETARADKRDAKDRGPTLFD